MEDEQKLMRSMAEAILKLPEEKKQYFLGYAECMVALTDSKPEEPKQE